jgi:hypothetical protein
MNKSDIEQMLKKQVDIDGDYEITADGVVDVVGNVDYKTNVNYLNVQFGTVTGRFARSFHSAGLPRLNSLKGFPHSVGRDVSVARTRIKDLTHAPSHVPGSFYAYHCYKLTSLQGAPTWVGGDFLAYKCALTSLVGAPRVVKGIFDVHQNPLENYDHLPESCLSVQLPYLKHAPMLRLLMYPDVHFRFDEATQQSHATVNEIMLKYAGTGRAGAIKAAVELIRAGYKENARW